MLWHLDRRQCRLVLVVQERMSPALLTYLFMSGCGFFSYPAIGKGGYTALLSAITGLSSRATANTRCRMVCVRTVDILIASPSPWPFLRPAAYAVYSWRYNLASALRIAPDLHRSSLAIITGDHTEAAQSPNAAMLQLRSLAVGVQGGAHLHDRTGCDPAAFTDVHQHPGNSRHTRPTPRDEQAMRGCR